MTDVIAQAAAALRQVADDWANRVYDRARRYDHRYQPEAAVKTAHCALGARHLAIHGVRPAEAEEILRQDRRKGPDNLFHHAERNANPERSEVLRNAAAALIESFLPGENRTGKLPGITEINDYEFGESRHDPDAIRWLRRAARRLENARPERAAASAEPPILATTPA